MMFAILEELCESGELRYIRAVRQSAPSHRIELQLIRMAATHRQPLPTDMCFSDRAEAEQAAALLRLLQTADGTSSYSVVGADDTTAASIRGLAIARATAGRQAND